MIAKKLPLIRFLSLSDSNLLLSNGLKGSVPPKNPGIREKLRSLYSNYGKVGFVTYMSVSTASMLTLYTLIKNGIDVGSVLGKIGLNPEKFKSSGTLVAAVAINKLLFPARLAATVFLTPRVSTLWRTLNKKP